MYGDRFNGEIGPVYLLLLPLLIVALGSRRALWPLWGVCAVYGLLWLQLFSVVRYLIPMLVLLAAAGAVALSRLAAGCSPRARIAVGGAVGAVVLLGLPPFAQFRQPAPWVPHRLEDVPWRVALGLEAADTYLERQLPAYGVYRALPSLGLSKRSVLVYWDGAWSYGLPYTEHVASRTYPREFYQTEAARLIGDLKRLDITHVLINKNQIPESMANFPIRWSDTDLVNRFLEPVVERNNVWLYKVHYDGYDPPVPVYYDVLHHLQLGEGAGTSGDDRSRSHSLWDGSEHRAGLLTIAPARATFRLVLSPQTRLDFGVGLSMPNAGDGVLARITVAPDGQPGRVVFARRVTPATMEEEGWQQHSLDLSAFGGQEVSVAFEALDPEGNGLADWILWSTPVVRAPGNVAVRPPS